MRAGRLLILFLFAFVTLAELMLYFDSKITFFLYFALIVFFLFSFSKAGALNSEGVFASLFIPIPIIRVISLFLHVSEFWNTLLIYFCFLYLVFVCIFRFKLKIFSTKKGYYIVYAMIVGIFLGIFSNAILDFTKSENLIYLLPLIVFTEEVYFRGILQKYIEEKYSRVIGIIFVSLLYGVLCLTQGYTIAIAFFIFYLMGSIFYAESKNVFVSMGLSLMFHLFAYVLVVN